MAGTFMTRRTFSKILVILIIIPIAIRVWQRVSSLGDPVVRTAPDVSPAGEFQIDEATDLSADASAKRSENE